MQKVRNVAIIAHVDHGKTTLVDKMLLAGQLFSDREKPQELILDNNDLERERGITIVSKNVSIRYKGYKINIIDTPGHSDFGGEVERVLNMADGVLLLVDAFEGPMPQTRFVLQKAIEIGLKPIVVINKVDKPNCRPEEVQEEVFDLMFNLDATEEQLDFPTIYGSAKNNWMSTDWKAPRVDDITPVLDAIIEHIPEPNYNEGPTQMLITSLDYSSFVGRIAVGRVHRGKIREGQDIALVKRDGSIQKNRIKELRVFEGFSQSKVYEAECGEIVAVESFVSADTDYSTQLTKLINAGGFDALFAPNYTGQLVTITNQARQLGWTGPMINGLDSAPPFNTMCEGSNADGVYFVSNIDLKDERVVAVVEAMQAATGNTEPNQINKFCVGYDMAGMLAQVIGANGTEADAIANGLANLSNYDGLTGKITIDPTTHQPTGYPMIMHKIEGGENKPVAEVVAEVVAYN